MIEGKRSKEIDRYIQLHKERVKEKDRVPEITRLVKSLNPDLLKGGKT